MLKKTEKRKPLTLVIKWKSDKISHSRPFIDPKGNRQYAIHRVVDSFKRIKTQQAAIRIIRNRTLDNIQSAVYFNNGGKMVTLIDNSII